MTEWQPIETAPQPCLALVFGQTNNGSFGRYVAHTYEGARSWFIWDDNTADSMPIHPTHWMPLPEPPA